MVKMTEVHISDVFLFSRHEGEVNNEIVVEMKTEKPNEQDGLLKNPSKDQVRTIRGQGSLIQNIFGEIAW